MTHHRYYEKIESDCPMCKGSGIRMTVSFANTNYQKEQTCDICKGKKVIEKYQPFEIVCDVTDEEIRKMYPKIKVNHPFGQEESDTRQYFRIQGAKEIRDKLAPTIAALKARVEELENETALGVHSCHEHCQRPLCIQRREIESLKQQLAQEKEKSKGIAIGFRDFTKGAELNDGRWMVWKGNDAIHVTTSELYDLYLTSLTKKSEGK